MPSPARLRRTVRGSRRTPLTSPGTGVYVRLPSALQTALRAHPTINLSDACRHGLRLAVARQERVLFDALVRDARLAICKEFGVPPLPSWDQWTVTVTDTWPNDGDPEG